MNRRHRSVNALLHGQSFIVVFRAPLTVFTPSSDEEKERRFPAQVAGDESSTDVARVYEDFCHECLRGWLRQAWPLTAAGRRRPAEPASRASSSRSCGRGARASERASEGSHTPTTTSGEADARRGGDRRLSINAVTVGTGLETSAAYVRFSLRI